ncbi:putative transposase [Gluconacetobacter sp. SXCC-1]|nr:putative transposase [Gluconacetobacter sp. SXCC-1]SAY46708.1 hypothetical protein KRIGEM_03525 [Komagataeibacter rhaeticus]
MNSFIPFDRSQPYLLPPDLKSWLPSDDVAHFIVAAVERMPLRAFSVPARTGGKAQYHPRLMLALLIYAYANGVFSSRRIERATYRDIGMRFVAANRSSVSSRAPWASPVSISVASPTSQQNGRSSPSHTIAAGSRD